MFITSTLVLPLTVFYAFFHVVYCDPVIVREDMVAGTILSSSYQCTGKPSFKTSGGISADFFKLNQTRTAVSLILNREVDLENKTDFPIVNPNTKDCLYKVKVDGYVLIFTCDGIDQNDELVIVPWDEFQPYYCAKNCSKVENIALHVPENTTVSTTLLDLNICDDDVNADTTSLMMQIRPGTYLTESNKRVFKLNTALDYESDPKTISSFASFNDKPVLNISITVTDSDDLGIAFDEQVFKCFISENYPQTVTNCTVLAVDLDKGLDTAVSYELLSVTPNSVGLFELLPNGSFSLKKPLDRENVPVYYLAIKGFQVDRPDDKISYTTVLFTVTDVDDHNPEMTKYLYNASVMENSPVGTIVCQLSATDKDEGENSLFQYQIVGVSPFFEVDGSTGSIKVKSLIDRETIGSNPVEIKVQAVSVKTPTKKSSAANVTVHILDENDNSPKFTHQQENITIHKTQTLNTNIMQINATDIDEGPNGKVSYRIESTDIPFHIDPNNGIVTLKRSLNETFEPIYSLVVIAEDNALKVQEKRSALLVVKVQVTDVNIHAPHFFKNLTTKMNISEDTMVEATVLELKATDKDPTDTLVYAVENGFGVFKIEDKYLKTTAALDREIKASYNIVLTVTDSVHVARRNLTVEVTDVNDNGPVFKDQHYVFNVTEEKSHSNFGTVSASDLDEGLNGEIVYEIDVGSKWSQYFALDKANGVLSTKGTLDREALSPDETVVFLVFAYDRGQPERMNSTSVTVNILDINDNGPAFDTNQRTILYEFKEGSHLTNFHIAKAFDADGKGFSDIFYKLKEENLQSIIDVTKEGNVSLLNALDFSDANGCSNTCVQFTIEAYNKQKYNQNAAGETAKNDTQAVVLNIKDINNHKPVFEKKEYSIPISECMEQNTEILRAVSWNNLLSDSYGNTTCTFSVTASDADKTAEFNTVFYWLEQKNDTFYVGPDTGSVYLTGNIDYDPPANQTSITFDVYATDDLKNRDRSVSTRVTLNISNCNDNPPIFSSGIYWCYIFENINGSFNCSPLATDADGDTIKYDIVPQQGKEFSMSTSSGRLSAVAAFDFDTVSSKEYKINVTAKDNTYTRFATVVVKVLDVNDERPVFKSNNYTFSIKENVKDVSYFVGEVKVSDADSTFSLAIDDCFSACKDCFGIGEKGEIVALRGFDHESSLPNHFTCKIIANDTSSDFVQRNISVNIIDVNDNTPTFAHGSFFSSVDETARTGTFVIQLSASDKDRNHGFNQVSHSIYGGNELGLFRIDSVNGSVFTNKTLEDNFGENITLMIQGCDNGTPHLCSYSQVTIHINNLNIHPPVLVGMPFHVQLKENEGKVLVLQVHAEDKDGDTLHYKVVNETQTFSFQNNALYASALDAEAFRNTAGLCYVKIQVSDGVHNVSNTVVVTVIDVNDNAPKLAAKSPKGYAVKVNDTTSIGETIYTITVQDNDISNKGFTYFLNGGRGDFDINQTTGDIILTNDLGNNGKTYNMSIVVMDHGDPPKSDTSKFNVEIIDTYPHFHFAGTFVVNMTEESATERASLAAVNDISAAFHVSYEIISANKNSILDQFNLGHSTGLLTLANTLKPLNYEQHIKYKFVLLAKDHGIFPKSALTNVTINVVDVNEKPNITNYEMVVIKEEHTPANSFITKIQADDPDITEPFNKLSFALSDNKNFKVDENGNITVKAKNLKAGNYSLTVTVTDGDNLKDTVSINIMVPSIKVESWNVSLRENNSVPYLIRKLGRSISGMTVTYNILRSSFSGIFIVTNNETLMLNDIIDREITDSITVHVNGRDTSSGILLSKITVIINVEDINDCSPDFPSRDYTVNIDDLTKSGTVIATIAAVDRDIDIKHRTLAYQLIGNEGLFSIDRLGSLKVNNASRLQTKTYDIVINVTDGMFQNKASLKINVVDTNDHSPGFSKAEYNFSITETNHTGIFVGSVVANDADSGRNGNITLSITGGNQNTAFKINGTSGLIETVKPVDRETLDKYQLILTAKDNGNSPRQGTCSVIVNVLDINDNTPKLLVTSVYAGTILENSHRNTIVKVVPTIDATDADFGANGTESLVYKLNDTKSPFCVSHVGSEASIFVCGDIDRELQDTYYLEVIVLDSNGSSGSRRTSAPLAIHVLDENDEVPQFTEDVYRFNVSENTDKSMIIGKVAVTDNDLNGNKDIKFGIANLNGNEVFVIDSDGYIRSTKELDYEKHSEYILNVTVNDTLHTDEASVHIRILPVNEYTPVFTKDLRWTVKENELVTKQISAVDNDKGDTQPMQFRADIPTQWVNNISLNSSSGIMTLSAIDREAMGSSYTIQFQVQVIDGGTPPRTGVAMVIITVTGVNDNLPVYLNETKNITLHVQEGKYDNLYQSKAFDADIGPGSEILYRLQTGQSIFNINRTSGILSPKNQLFITPSNNGSLHVDIEAFNANGTQGVSVQHVTIMLKDINNHKPVFAENEYRITISECMEPGTEILRVSASDADATAEFNTVFYWLEQYNDTFYVGPDTGSVYLTGNVDYDPPAKQTNITFDVYATDEFKSLDRSISTRVTLNISNCNDNPPVFSSGIYWCDIFENVNGSFNCSPLATDADGDTIRYGIVPQQGKEFSISTSTGSISAIAAFDSDTMNSKEYNINITANDNKYTRFATVLVKVLDVNDERPVFKSNKYRFSIKENVKDVSYFVGEVKVTDADSTFSLSIDDCFSSCKDCFRINEKGDIVALKEFDFESPLPNHFTCEITANDTSSNFVNRNISIDVIDVNDNMPIFTHDSLFLSVNETAKKGTFVTQLSASDKDGNQGFNRVSYSIYGGNELGLFRIDSVNGSMFTNKTLEDNFGEKITLMIQACDNGRPQLCSYSHLTIQINNLNIHPPAFIGMPFHVQLKENSGKVLVLQVHAVDKDGDTLHYKVVNETQTFSFQNNVLYASALDAEVFRNTAGLCYLKIQVSDGVHNVSGTVVVTVIDVNDNAPELAAKSPKGYAVKVNDTTSVGEAIYTITVHDNDISNKGFTYFLYGGRGDFDINQTTGDVVLTNDLGNNGKTYDMSIVVMDHGDPPKSDSSKLYVQIVDTYPHFRFKGNFVVNMTEESTTEQTSLAAFSDNGDVFHVGYEIISANKNSILELFSLDHSTGLLTLANTSNPLNYEQQSNYEFTLLTKDYGVFPKTAVTNVTINVVDVNEKPNITKYEIVVIKEEHTPVNSFITKVQADDPDITEPFNKLSFTLSDTRNFKIEENGNISVKAKNLEAGNYSLIVTVTDGGNLTDAVTINVVVPSIKVDSLKISLRENNSVPYLITQLGRSIGGMTVIYNVLQSSFSGMFMVTNNESVTLNDIIDREITESITVHVNGRDTTSGIFLSKTTIVIHVEDINDCSPDFPLRDYTVNIDDLTKSGTVLATIAAVDRDIDERNRNLTYMLIGTDGLFSMNRMGSLTIQNASRLQTRAYDIVINVTDGRFQNKAFLKINVVDTNNHSPGFTKAEYRFNITETNHTGTTVGSVVAHDADSGHNGNVTLSITAGNQNTVFKINGTSGLIETVKPVDREYLDKYQLIITAKDNGNTPRQGTCTVIVNVLDLNDNTPKLQVISVYTGSVLENSKRNTNVKVLPAIAAADADFGANGLEGLVYKLNDTRSPFCVSRVGSGASISVCDDIDRELQDTYYLEVIVLDSNGSSGSRRTSAPLTILVLDENDEVPQFTEDVYRFNISENTDISMIIGKVAVTDNDLNGNKDIKFGIAKGDEGKFHIDTYTGGIYVVGSIDREKQSEYTLYVIAFDGINKNLTQVTIHVTDVNDNAPVFTMFVVDVEENRTGIIFNATAHDKDEQFTKNSRVTFSTQSHDGRGAKTSKFSITRDGGLYLTSPLDRETNDHYEVTITATDNGMPPLSSSLVIYVNVLDINDNTPVICADGKCGIPETEIHISDKTPALSVLKILGSKDPDAGSNGTVTYSFMQTTLSKYFKLEEKTGVVRVIEPKTLQQLSQSGNIDPNAWNIKAVALDGGGHTSNTLTMRVLIDP